MKIAIISGGSKGIGKALVEEFLKNNYTVFSLSRSFSNIEKVTQISVDLSNLSETISAFKKLLNLIDNKKEIVKSIVLINNAGRLGKVAHIENIDAIDIYNTIQLNITATLVLSKMFIGFVKNLNIDKTIINISSGAAKKPYSGWSIYCCTKYSIDMITKSIYEEQKNSKNKIKIFGIRPGVVDTNMQNEIRNTNEKDFKSKKRFVNLKKENKLLSPNFVANKIYFLLENKNLISGNTIDLRDYYN